MLCSFEEFSLDIGRRELWRGGELIAIEPKVFDLLVHLVTQRERVVSKNDLVEVVGKGALFRTRRSRARSTLRESRSAIAAMRNG
jgi:DNA-binding winged helix-turn-helix (wHTH) protein